MSAPTATPALQRVRHVLSAWLPGRAATRVLERAIRAEGLRPDEIDDEALASLLLGRIYRDLRDTVPHSTLRRELKRLARSLQQQPATPSQGLPASADPRITANEVATPVPPTANERATATTAVPEPAPAAVASQAPVRRQLPSDAEVVLMGLAVLEGVDGAAVFDGVGRTLETRGEVPDVDALGRVIAAGGSLLEQHGPLRSVSITTSGGVMIAVPVPPRWIAVSGAPDMNLGAVYAALTALEEER